MHSKDIEILIETFIKDYISSLNDDIDIIEKHYLDSYKNFEETAYQNRHVYTLMETGIAESTLSILKTLSIEVATYETFLDDESIVDLADIFFRYDYPRLWERIIQLIFRAKYELALFSLSGISENDYNRDIQTIQKAAAKIERYSEVTGSLSIPKNKSSIVRSLAIELDELFVCLNQKEAKEIIKIILDVFFDYARIPSYTIAIRPDGQKRNNKKGDPIIVKCVPAPRRK